MKIVIISPFQKTMPRGIERFCFSLANALAALGHHIIIYAWASKKEFSWGQLHANVQIKECPNLKYYQRSWIGYYYNLLLSKDKPDAVLLNFLYHGELKLSKKWTYYYVLHSPASQIKNRYEFIKNHINKFKNLQFIAVSNMVKREALPFLEGKKCTVVFNGVDLELFKPAEKNIQTKKLKIITVAALEERKGIQHMFAAIASYPRKELLEYHVYGNGPYNTKLVALINEYNLQSNVTLNKPVSNLNEVLQKFQLFALLSKGEAFPIAPLEAMASGLPLLVSHHEPYSEFLKPAFGFMIKPNKIDSLHTVFDTFIDDKNTLESMAKSSRDAALDYSWNIVAKQYVKYIEL